MPNNNDQLLTATKLALRITTDAYDSEITRLLNTAKLDLGVAGVELPSTLDGLVTTACITYVKMQFGSPEEYERLKRSYDEQKAQMATCTGYTDWLVSNGQV